MNKKTPIILISNDDGYKAKGIRSLVKMLSGIGKIIVCAPDSGRSGFSCAFSASIPVTVNREDDIEGAQVWSCSGTPVDCVKLAFEKFFTDEKPDIIISGINHGDNSSVNNHYSGTVGVAKEGCMKGIPSVAFSLCSENSNANFEPLTKYVKQIVEQVLQHSLPNNVCLNVNFPNLSEFKGVKVCRMANGSWVNEIESRVHPFGREYHWLAGHFYNLEPNAEDTDRWALKNGFVAITPTTIDVTDYKFIDNSDKWNFNV